MTNLRRYSCKVRVFSRRYPKPKITQKIYKILHMEDAQFYLNINDGVNGRVSLAAFWRLMK